MSNAVGSPPQQQLEYATQPVAGNVVVQRTPGELTLRMLRSRWRLAQATALAVMGFTWLAAVVRLVGTGRGNEALFWMGIFAIGFLVLATGMVIGGMGGAGVTLNRHTIVARWRVTF